jgi:hypothetical protein
MMPRWRFLIWFSLLIGLWMLLNWPSPQWLKNQTTDQVPFLRTAGCPLRFAQWEYNQLAWLDVPALVVDLGFGLGFAVGIASLCVWSQRRHALPE